MSEQAAEIERLTRELARVTRGRARMQDKWNEARAERDQYKEHSAAWYAAAGKALDQVKRQAAELAALRERAERAERERDAAEQAPAGWVSGNGVLHLFAAVEDMKVWMDAHPGEWGAAGVLHNTEWHPRSRPAPEPTP